MRAVLLSLSVYILYLIITKSVKKFDVSSSVQAKTLSDTIYKQKEMIEQLSHISESIHTFSNIELIMCLQAELHAISKSEVNLEIFESKKDINKLNIFILTE